MFSGVLKTHNKSESFALVTLSLNRPISRKRKRHDKEQTERKKYNRGQLFRACSLSPAQCKSNNNNNK